MIDPVAGALARQRRQLAADLHDLVMQDLALALASARKLAEHPACAGQASDAIAAGERALAGARRMLEDLSAREHSRSVVEAVETSVRAAARATPISFDARRVPRDSQPDEPTLHALVHIGREAVTNATKHSDPTAIEVVLERADEWLLRVQDDGRGWGACLAAGSEAQKSLEGSGFGLDSMRRCAHALGGSLHISSAPEGGTMIEAVLP